MSVSKQRRGFPPLVNTPGTDIEWYRLQLSGSTLTSVGGPGIVSASQQSNEAFRIYFDHNVPSDNYGTIFVDYHWIDVNGDAITLPETTSSLRIEKQGQILTGSNNSYVDLALVETVFSVSGSLETPVSSSNVTQTSRQAYVDLLKVTRRTPNSLP